MRHFNFKGKKTLLVIAIFLFSLIVLLGLFLFFYNKDNNLSFDIDDVLYAGNDVSYIVDIPDLKNDNLLYKFDTTDSNVAQFSYEELKSKDEGNTLNIKGSGKIKIIIHAYDGNRLIDTYEKEIVVCKAFNNGTFPFSKYSFGVGDSASLNLDLGSEKECYDRLSYKSSDTSVVNVSDGVVTGMRNGDATITVSNGISNISTKVSVVKKDENVSVSDISVNVDEVTVNVGKIAVLTYNIKPSNATNKAVLWESQNDDIAIVSSKGVVTGVKEGTTFIKVTTQDGNKTDFVKVVVKKVDKVIKVTDVNVDVSNHKLLIGDSVKINPVVSPSNATDKSVKFISSDTSIVKVDSSGNVMALKEGNCVIIVRTVDGGKEVIVGIEVVKPSVDLLSISVDSLPNKVNYYVNDTFSKTGLKVVGNYSDGTKKDITSLCTLSKPDMSVAGSKTINVSYSGKSTSFKINVSVLSISKTSSGVIGSYCDDCLSSPGDSIILTTKNYKYTYNDFNKLSFAEKQLIYDDIKNPYIITAPHSVKQLREGEIKVRDMNTGEMCESVAKLTNSVCISRQSYDETDPNYYSDTLFVTFAKTISSKKNAILNMDLHGIAANKYEFGFAIGTKKGTVLSNAYKCIDKKLASYLYQNTGENVSVNTYSSCDYGTSSYLIISDKTLQGGQVIGSNIASNNIQLEMVPNYRVSGASMVANFILNNF